MQWCKKGYQSPLPLVFGLFVHQITRSRVLVDVLYKLGLSLSYSTILDFEKYASVSTIEFTDALSEEKNARWNASFSSSPIILTTMRTQQLVRVQHIMGLISSQYPKSDTLSLHPIMK